MNLKILVVDDEEPARKKIQRFIHAYDENIEIVTATDAIAAIKQLTNDDFQLIFLDIQMPKMDAFQMLETLDITTLPPIIFSTAFNQYAVKAFELHAVDYLLKPYDQERFNDSISRVLKPEDRQNNDQKLEYLIESWKPPNRENDILWIHHGNKIIPLKISQVEFVESDGNYVKVYSGDKKYLVRNTLKKMGKKLDNGIFKQVHRSYIVNTQFIESLTPKSHGDLYAQMQNGAQVPISRNYRDDLMV